MMLDMAGMLGNQQVEAHARLGMVECLLGAEKLDEAQTHLEIQQALAEKMGNVPVSPGFTVPSTCCY